MTPDDPRHGTYAGWNKHQASKTPVCEPCRVAQRQYMRDYRAKTRSGRRIAGSAQLGPQQSAHASGSEASTLFQEELSELAEVGRSHQLTNLGRGTP